MKRVKHNIIYIIGWIFAVAALFKMPIFFASLGIAIGLILLKNTKKAAALIICSTIFAVINISAVNILEAILHVYIEVMSEAH